VFVTGPLGNGLGETSGEDRSSNADINKRNTLHHQSAYPVVSTSGIRKTTINMKYVVVAALAVAAKASPAWPSNNNAIGNVGSVVSSLTQLLRDDSAMNGPFAPITNQIVKDYVEPIEVNPSAM